MSVVLFREIWSGRKAKAVYSYIPSDSVTRMFLVRTNNRADDASVIYSYTGAITTPYSEAAGCPQLGYIHPLYTLMFLQGVDFRQHDQSPYEWLCAFDYSDAPIKPPQNVNPLTRPAAIVGGTVRSTHSTLTDYQGNGRFNSAGDLYDPVEIPDANFAWSVSKNVGVDSIPSFILTIGGGQGGNNDVGKGLAVNSDSWTMPQIGLTFPAKTLLVSDFGHSDIKTEVIGNANILYRTFTFVLSLDTNTWVEYPLDRGWRALTSGSNPTIYDIRVPSNISAGADGTQSAPGPLVKPSKPVLLDGAGHYYTNQNPTPTVFPPGGYDLFQPFDFSNLTPYCQ